MSATASQITSLTIVYSATYLMRKSKKTIKAPTSQCAGSSPVTGETPHKGPVTRKMFPFDDVIMYRSAAITTTIMNLKRNNVGITTFRQMISDKVWFSTHSPDALSTVSLSLLHNSYFIVLIILIFMETFGFQSYISVNGKVLIL